MKQIVNALYGVFLLPCFAMAQITPEEGKAVNYRVVGFEFPAKERCQYRLEIATGTYDVGSVFDKKIIIAKSAATNRLICEVPAFGTEYTWRVVYTGPSNNEVPGALHHFTTAYFKGIDTNLNRLRIIDKAVKYKDAYVFIEANRALYDMKGRPVWFLPEVDHVNTDYTQPIDMQLSPQGTITFIHENRAAYEVDYDGEILFKTPNEGRVSGDTIEHYHHSFNRLKNGHYMVLGSSIARWDRSPAAANDSTALAFPPDRKKPDPERWYQEVPFGTIIEYDKAGNIVWSWNSAAYFKNSDIFNHLGRDGKVNVAPHANSLYFDEVGKAAYIGFRDINRVLKVSYPGGKVLGVYGEIFKKGMPEQGNGLFCKQHSAKLNSRGDLYLFNNNSCDFTGFPSVVVFNGKPNDNGTIEKVWEYTCPIEGESGKTQTSYQFTYGGNVTELPDHSYFTSMSTLYSRVFIVSPGKKLLWSAIPERWNKDTNKWEHVFQYKASLINSRKDLERLIWSQQKK